MLINKEIWFSKPSGFNDPFDCNIDIDSTFDDVQIMRGLDKKIDYLRNEVKKLKKENKYAYFCACNNCVHTLMWSHYANNHKGIAFGFTFADLTPEMINYVKGVDYLMNEVENSYNLMCENNDCDEVSIKAAANYMFKILRFLKAECWQYEKKTGVRS